MSNIEQRIARRSDAGLCVCFIGPKGDFTGAQSTHGSKDGRRHCDFCSLPLFAAEAKLPTKADAP